MQPGFVPAWWRTRPARYCAPDPSDGWWGDPITFECQLPNASRYRRLVLGFYIPDGHVRLLDVRTKRMTHCGAITTGTLVKGGGFRQAQDQDCLSTQCSGCGWCVRAEPMFEALDVHMPTDTTSLLVHLEPEDWEAASRMLARKKGASYRALHYADGSKVVLTDLAALAPRAAKRYRFVMTGSKANVLAHLALACFLPDLRSGKGQKITGRGWGIEMAEEILECRGGSGSPPRIWTDGEAGVWYTGDFLRRLKRKMLTEHAVAVVGDTRGRRGRLRPRDVPDDLTGAERSEYLCRFYALLHDAAKELAKDLADVPPIVDVPAVRVPVGLTYSGDILGRAEPLASFEPVEVQGLANTDAPLPDDGDTPHTDQDGNVLPTVEDSTNAEVTR